MSTANLNFTVAYTPPASNAVLLKFGAADDVEVDPLTAVLLMSKAAPRMTVGSAYASNVSRPITTTPDMSWQQANDGDVDVDGGWGVADSFRFQTRKPWGLGLPLSSGFSEHSGQLLNSRNPVAIPWVRTQRLDAEPLSAGFQEMVHTRHLREALWQVAEQLSKGSSDSFVQLSPFKHLKELTWQVAARLAVLHQQAYNVGRWYATQKRLPWQEGRKSPSGRELPPVVPPVNPYEPSYDLNFLCKCTFPSPLSVLLNFGKHPCPGGGDVIADRKVYFIVNTLSLKRVADNTPIELISASVGIDNASWCWSFSGSVPYTEFENIEPTASGPVEVELEINGITWRLLVEKYNSKELFTKTDISISGRSVTAWLENPYAPARSFVQETSLTSRQLAEAELTRAGLVTGFTLDWQLIDALGWQMPANTWSYADMTPVQVIQAIAQGAGGYVNSHRSSKQLIVLPEYPLPYWEWAGATVDKTLPESLIKARSLSWEEKPQYNGVYVSGENTGVTAFVRRTGTDGSTQAQMFVSPMISHQLAARQKGIAILSAGGKQSRVSLDLPMEPTLGLVTPGMLVQVQKDVSNNWRGLVRSTQVQAAWSDGLTITQSIELERHYGGL
jgi:hypothetical protein